ncbi:hypothetical protein BaRGS_00003035, partial [Batillaria attramentaria]
MAKLLLMILLLLPTTVLFVGQPSHSRNIAFADDSMEGEEDDATVETDDGVQAADEDTSDEGDSAVTDSDTRKELPAGKQVRLLVGFTNKGDGEFVVEGMDASFRYPQDYSFYLQNFTTMPFNRVVESKRQATFEYGFVPNEAFSSRPFGLTVNINYKDSEGNLYQNAVFNETIQVVEPDEGLDGETFFLYVFLAALGILLLVGAQQLVSSLGRKRLSKPRQVVEMGTQNADIDYDWLPKETIQEM